MRNTLGWRVVFQVVEEQVSGITSGGFFCLWIHSLKSSIYMAFGFRGEPEELECVY